LKSRTLLVVDDEPANVELIRMIVEDTTPGLRETCWR
jgi:CheY-like chemotaxis protein